MVSTRGHPRRLSPVLSLASLGLLLVLAVVVLWFFGVLSPSRLQGKLLLASTEYELVFSELDSDTTTIWASSPEAPGQRRSLAKIQHEAHFGVKASLSPDGKRLAYAFLPKGTRNIDSGASLAVVNIDGGETSLLTKGVDLQGRPLWSTDGKGVLYRRVTSLQDNRLRHELLMVDIEQRQIKSLVTDNTALGLYPFGWSKDGRTVYYSRLSEKGTEVMMLDTVSGNVGLVAHLSFGVARDLQLSPNGQEILFSAPKALGTGANYIIGTLSVDVRTKTILKEGPSDHYHPIWHPEGDRIAYSSDPQETLGRGGILDLGRDASAVVSVLTAPVGGFDLPLAWSPDSRYLAIRALVGESSQRVTGEGLLVLSPLDGRRHPLDAAGHVEFIGWLAKGQ